MQTYSYAYNSLEAHCLFYSVPFLLLLDYFYLKENALNVARMPGREKVFNRHVSKIAIFTILFMSVQVIVNIFFHTLFFGAGALASVDFYLHIILSMIGFSLYYTTLGLLYNLIFNVFDKKGIALFIVYFSVVCMYFLCKQLNGIIWTPMDDLAYLSFLPVLVVELSKLINVYVRELLVIFTLYFVGLFVFVKKDLIE